MNEVDRQHSSGDPARSSLGRLKLWLADTRRWAALFLVVTALSTGWVVLSAVPPSATTGGRIPSPREGFQAPPIQLEDLRGSSISLSDLRGNVVVVNFWASWCLPCRAEMPDLQRAFLAEQEKGLVVLGVNTTYQDVESDARQFASDRGVTFPVLLDTEGVADRSYQVRALPSTFFVDRRGVIRKVIIGGPMSEATLRSTVRELLDEAP